MARVVASAPESRYLGGFAVIFREISTRLDIEPETLEVGVGDDVDNTANGVRAVNGRCSVLQYLDALYHIGGQGIQVNGAWYSGSRSPRNPAFSVDEYERALGADVAQS